MRRSLHILLLLAALGSIVACRSRKEILPFEPASVEMYQPGKYSGEGVTAMFIEAKKELILGNYQKAEILLRQVIAKDPGRDAAYYELAILYRAVNNLADARDMAAKAVTLDPANKWYQSTLAGICELNQDYPAAVRIYEQLIKQYPNDLEYRLQLAAGYVYTGKIDDALRQLDFIESITGINEEIVSQKQKLYLHLNRIEEAAEEIRKLINAYPDESRFYAWLAELYMSNGMPEKALDVYNSIAAQFPDDPYIHISLADYYRKKGDQERSFGELKLGFANPELNIDTKIQVMLTYYSMGNFVENIKNQALELADILVATHPGDPKAHSMRADFLVREERFQEARDEFRNVIALDSSRFLVWENLLRVEAELGDYRAMKDESYRMIELFPVQPLGYLFHGVAAYQLKDYETALNAFKQGVQFVFANNLLSSQFYAYLGDVSYQTGDAKTAFEYYEKTLQYDPNNSYVLNNYAYYLSLKGENLEKAETMAQKATTLDPANSANLDTYGWVLYKLGRYQDAEIWIRKALDAGAGEDPVVLEHYGDVMYKLDQPEKAREYWYKAQQAGKGSEFLGKKIADGILYE